MRYCSRCGILVQRISLGCPRCGHIEPCRAFGAGMLMLLATALSFRACYKTEGRDSAAPSSLRERIPHGPSNRVRGARPHPHQKARWIPPTAATATRAVPEGQTSTSTPATPTATTATGTRTATATYSRDARDHMTEQ